MRALNGIELLRNSVCEPPQLESELCPNRVQNREANGGARLRDARPWRHNPMVLRHFPTGIGSIGRRRLRKCGNVAPGSSLKLGFGRKIAAALSFLDGA